MRIKAEDFIHPELRSNEIFFTNASEKQFEMMEWKSKRKGKIAYDGKGNQLHHDDWFPVFISAEELNMSNKNISETRRMWRDSITQPSYQ